jgi:hypothetical protein
MRWHPSLVFTAASILKGPSPWTCRLGTSGHCRSEGSKASCVSRAGTRSLNPVPILCLAATVFFAVTPCFGSEITISYNAGDGCSGSTTSTTYSTTCTGATLGAVTTLAAEASLTVLKLGLNSAGLFPADHTGSNAHIRVTDTITVTGGTGSGTLIWVWAMDGTLDASDTFFSQVYLSNLGGSAFADFRACGAHVQFGGFICAFDATPNPPGGFRVAQPHETVNATRSISIPFVFGVPLTVDWRLSSLIASGCTFGPSCTIFTPNGSGTVAFFNTLRLQPLLLLDSSGAEVPGGSVLSDSGFSYALVGQPTAQMITVTQGVPATASFNTSFPVSATASSGLSVTIAASGACAVISAGTVKMTSGTGTCTVIFDQVGDADHLPAPQVVQATTAQKASQTIAVTQGAPATAAFHATFSLSATAPGGPVAIAASGVCAFSAGIVTMTSATGTCTMTFDQTGSADYVSAPQVTQTTTARQASQVITVTQGAPATARFKQTFHVAATAPGGPAVIAVSGACSIKAGTLTMKRPTAKRSACTVTFDQPGNANYFAAQQVVQTTTVR